MLAVSLGLHELVPVPPAFARLPRKLGSMPPRPKKLPEAKSPTPMTKVWMGPFGAAFELGGRQLDARVGRVAAEQRDAHAVVARDAVGDEDQHLLAARLQGRRRGVRLEGAIAAAQCGVGGRSVLGHAGEAHVEGALVGRVDEGDWDVGTGRVRAAAPRGSVVSEKTTSPAATPVSAAEAIWPKIDSSAGTTAVHLLSEFMLPEPSSTKSRYTGCRLATAEPVAHPASRPRMAHRTPESPPPNCIPVPSSLEASSPAKGFFVEAPPQPTPAAPDTVAARRAIDAKDKQDETEFIERRILTSYDQEWLVLPRETAARGQESPLRASHRRRGPCRRGASRGVSIITLARSRGLPDRSRQRADRRFSREDQVATGD